MSDEIRFDTYYPYTELTTRLQGLAAAYPHLLRIESIGKSYEGRDVWCLTATNFATGPAEEKPAFWCDGNIHATEVSASSACLFSAAFCARDSCRSSCARSRRLRASWTHDHAASSGLVA